MKRLFPSKPNCSILSLWTNVSSDVCFQLWQHLTALPGVALRHGRCSLGPILCPGFGSLDNSLSPKAATSPLAWLVGGYTGAMRGIAILFSKILRFALTQNILFNEKLSSVLHPKLGETKTLKKQNFPQRNILVFICSSSHSTPKGAVPCCSFFFWYSINYIHLQGEEGCVLWRWRVFFWEIMLGVYSCKCLRFQVSLSEVTCSLQCPANWN